MINYIFYTIVSLGCAYLIYQLVLKAQKTFQFNRFFLLGTLLLSLMAPIMEINVLDTMPSITEISLEPSEVSVVSHEILEGVTVAEIQKPKYSIFYILWYVYLTISICFAIRFIKNIFGIIKLTKRSHGRIGSLKLVETNDGKNASSFFNYLFINTESLKDKCYSDSMIQHELVHCNQWHTLDVIVLELLLCAFWFNPFIWFYRMAIVQNHEFIADGNTVQSGIDIINYSQIIIHSSHKEYRVPLTSGFNFIQIKNRITMLHQSQSSVLKRTLKITAALLLFASVFMFSSFKDLKEPLIVVVDAGHGGKDPGNLNEKDIVLRISKQLSKMSNEKIKIITIRDKDKFWSLEDRVNFINDKNADLVISLHTNAYKDTSVGGVEAYYYDKNNYGKKSHDYSKILLQNQLHLFSSKRKIKQAGFYILKNVNCPAVLLELGFITNEKDKAILTNGENQKAIAKSLFKSLLEIRATK
ncbi:N-acetylmuramoyl-L-alanine amidase [Psychroserpens ponticola]|uniref:N-acetylmuramoyl-L-alanine amidase n=1 Tax=Psychroserpens ponticola TaxID=2932268 RepID=A0ABY7RU69_9FLAO|nr:N-acetylmuramoyl-L-alanine amidase [Psychroserpens ponticola]WCO00668.1 N-acetylmuramoyl-L-alanine amidase [Psychroserpens ponticola]